MLEFITTVELKPNTELLELIKDFTYTINKGKIKHLVKTNLQFVEPTQYLITYRLSFLCKAQYLRRELQATFRK